VPETETKATDEEYETLDSVGGTRKRRQRRQRRTRKNH
jgi:hypothetical protein